VAASARTVAGTLRESPLPRWPEIRRSGGTAIL